MQSYADDLANTDKVAAIITDKNNFVIDQVRREVTHRYNRLNSDLKILSQDTIRVEQKVQETKDRVTGVAIVIILLQVAILGILLSEHIPQIY